MNVTGIATQGRNSPKEYVMEYGISFGSNGLDYAAYREIDGSTKVSHKRPPHKWLMPSFRTDFQVSVAAALKYSFLIEIVEM